MKPILVLIFLHHIAAAALTVSEDVAAREWKADGERGARYTFALRVRNDGEAAAEITIAQKGAKLFALHHAASQTVAAKSDAIIAVAATISADAAAKLPPFSPESCVITLGAAAWTARVPLLLSTAGKLTPPGEAYLTEIRTRTGNIAWAKSMARAERNSADKFIALGDKIEPPTETGWLEGAEDFPFHMLHWPKYEKTVARADGGIACPVCGRGWSRAELASGRGRFHQQRSALVPLGMTAMLTGDAHYAQPAIAILEGMARSYAGYPAGPWQTKLGLNFMHECQYLSLAARCLRYLQTAKLLPAEAQRRIAAGFVIPSVEILLATELGTPNQKGLRAATVGECGLVLGWPPYVAWSLRHEPKGMFPLVREMIGADGGWLEGSLSYHMTALLWIMPLPAVLHSYGYNILDEEGIGERLHDFLLFPILARRPDDRLAAINDSGLGSPANPWHAAGYRLTQDAALLPWIQNHLEYGLDSTAGAVKQPITSRDFPDFGIAVLHDGGAAEKENWVLLDYGMHGGGHGHFDKLNVVSYAHGQPVNDALGSSYSSPLQFSWLRHTLSHSTITVDETAQQPTTGKLEFLQIKAGRPQFAVASTGGAYPGVKLERTIALIAGVQVFVDHAVSEREHTFDWTFTCWGKIAGTSTPSRESPPLPFTPLAKEQVEDSASWNGPPPKGVGYDVPQNLRETQVDGAWWVDFADVKPNYPSPGKQPLKMRWLAWSSSPQRVVWGDAPGHYLKPDAIRWLMARQHGKEAAWVTVLVPQTDDPPPVSEIKVVPAATGHGIGIELKTRTGSAWIAVNWKPGETLKAGPITTTEHAAAQP